MPKRSKRPRSSRTLQLDTESTMEAVSFEDAVRGLEADLRVRRKGKNLSVDARESVVAKDLLELLMNVRFAIGKGDAEQAALLTLKLGCLMRGFEWVFCHMEDYYRGVKSGEGASFGGSRKSKAVERRDIQMAEEYMARSNSKSGSKSSTALSAEIGKKHNLSRSTSVEAVERGLKAINRQLRAEKARLRSGLRYATSGLFRSQAGNIFKDFVRQGGKPDE
jgi:hypothetical protein